MSKIVRRSRQVIKAARVLTDPDPLYVSAVRNGANQTPFRVVKQEDEPAAVPVGAHKETDDMTIKTKDKTDKRAKVQSAATVPAAKAEAVPEVQSMFFPIETFATEGDVKAHLEKHHIATDATIEKSEKGWTIKGLDADAFEGGDKGLKEIEFEGVTLTVGMLKDEAASKADEPAAEDATATTKGAGPEDEEDEQDDGEEVAADAVPVMRMIEKLEDAKDEDKLVYCTSNHIAYAREADGKWEPLLKTADPVKPDFDAALATAKAGLAAVASGVKKAKGKGKKFEKITDVLTAMDNVPPGFYDLMTAFSYVCRSAFDEKDFNRIRRAARDMGEYIIQLGDLFSEQSDTKSMAIKMGDGLRTALTPKAEEQPAQKSDKVEAPAPAAAATTTSDEPVADPVMKAIADMALSVKALGERVEQIAAGAADAGSSVAVQLDRKGADEGAEVDDEEEDEDKAVKTAKSAAPAKKDYTYKTPTDRLRRNLLGLPPLEDANRRRH